MAFCINCGHVIDAEYDFCPECGIKIIPSVKTCENDSVTTNEYDGPTKRCMKCGELMPTDVFYCLNCGASFDNPQNNFEIKYKTSHQFGTWRNKWVSFFLCLFLGWLGVHKFYEGKVFVGLIYLFSLGLLGAGWFVDLIILLLKPNPYLVERK